MRVSFIFMLFLMVSCSSSDSEGPTGPSDTNPPLPVSWGIELDSSGSDEGIHDGSIVTTWGIALAIDQSSGYPAVAWGQTVGATEEIYFKRWNGTAWEALGGSTTGEGISTGGERSRSPTLAVDVYGRYVIAWEEKVGTAEKVYVRRWNGTSWVALATSASGNGISPASGSSTAPSLVEDGSGNLYVAWSEYVVLVSAYEVYMKKWNGTSWTEVGGSASTGGISATPEMSFRVNIGLDDLKRPTVAWSEDHTISSVIFFKHWNGTIWEELGGSATGMGLGYGDYPATSGWPPAVVHNSYPQNKIFLKRWNGGMWVELGGSASGTGIGDGLNDIQPSVVSYGSDLVVAWTSWNEILLKKWNGTAWIEVDGSITDGGVSRTSTASGMSKVTFVNGTITVAWWEEGGKIYLRQE